MNKGSGRDLGKASSQHYPGEPGEDDDKLHEG